MRMHRPCRWNDAASSGTAAWSRGRTMTGPELTPEEADLYKTVPADGSTIGNQRAQQMLRWKDEKYWTTRDSLVDKSLLTRGRGRGGTLRRVVLTPATEVIAVAVPIEIDSGPGQVAYVEAVIRREEELYPPLAEVIRGDWSKDHRATPIAVEIVARQGRRSTGGTWSRPDIVTVEVKTLLYIPTKILEVTTFEVKSVDAIDVQAVYEALAHRRASTHAYVVLHVPTKEAVAQEENIQSVRTVARSYGVGVITVGDPTDYSTWDELEEATRVEPDPERLNSFIETQLPERVKNRIARELR